MTTNFLTDKETLDAINKENKRLINKSKKNNSQQEVGGALSDTSSNRMKPADTYNKITKEKKEGFIHWLGNTKVKSQIELDFKFSFYFIMILLCFLSIIWLTIKGVQIIIK